MNNKNTTNNSATISIPYNTYNEMVAKIEKQNNESLVFYVDEETFPSFIVSSNDSLIKDINIINNLQDTTISSQKTKINDLNYHLNQLIKAKERGINRHNSIYLQRNILICITVVLMFMLMYSWIGNQDNFNNPDNPQKIGQTNYHGN